MTFTQLFYVTGSVMELEQEMPGCEAIRLNGFLRRTLSFCSS